MNVDTATVTIPRGAAAAAVAKDDQGQMIGSVGLKLASYSSFAAEMEAIRLGLLFGRRFGVSQMIIESDSLNAASLFNLEILGPWAVKTCFLDCKNLISMFQNCDIVYVP